MQSADIILHVRDVAHEDTDAQRLDVISVLGDLGIDADHDDRVIEVLNKVDLLTAAEAEVVRNQAMRQKNVVISALTGVGIGDLLQSVRARIDRDRKTVDLHVSVADGRAIAWLHDRGEVLERRDDETWAHMRVKLSEADLSRFRQSHPDAVEAVGPT